MASQKAPQHDGHNIADSACIHALAEGHPSTVKRWSGLLQASKNASDLWLSYWLQQTQLDFQPAPQPLHSRQLQQAALTSPGASSQPSHPLPAGMQPGWHPTGILPAAGGLHRYLPNHRCQGWGFAQLQAHVWGPQQPMLGGLSEGDQFFLLIFVAIAAFNTILTLACPATPGTRLLHVQMLLKICGSARQHLLAACRER